MMGLFLQQIWFNNSERQRISYKLWHFHWCIFNMAGGRAGRKWPSSPPKVGPGRRERQVSLLYNRNI